jgi:outer membrane protein assembly factor BamB
MRASVPVALVLVLLQLTSPLVAQHPHHPTILVGARVKLDVPSGIGNEGTLLAWRGDTVVLKLASKSDTVRVAATMRNGIRVIESPALWRDTTGTGITFYTTFLVPRSDGRDSSEHRFRHLLLVGTVSQLTGFDPSTGRAIWTRPDLPDLKLVAVDFVGRTGYGIITQGDRMSVVDLRTGQTSWDTRALSFTAARGWLPLAGPDTSILMLGRTAESPTTLVAVNLTTGKVLWRQDHLFGVEPKVFSTSGVSYLLGQQVPLSDTDSTLILFIGAEGPMRLDARTGALLWRSNALGIDVPAPHDGYASMRARRGVIYIPSEKQLIALRAIDGHPAWNAPHVCKNKVIDMVWTPHGLLIRGDDWIDLIDPVTGKSFWPSPAGVKSSTAMALRGDTIYIIADKKLLGIRVPDGTVRTLTELKYPDHEALWGFAVFREGIVLNTWHHALQFDRQGGQRNHVFYPSPKENFGEALTAAGIGIGANRPITTWDGGDLYFYTGAPDNDQVQGLSLVKFDPAAWREDGRIWFTKRVPDYLVDWSAGMVYSEPSNDELVGLTFGDATALAAAVDIGPSQVTRLLDIGADVNAVDSYRWTSLHQAAATGQTEVVRLLVARGAQVDAQTQDGWTPWMVAAAHGYSDIMGLLQDAGAHTTNAAATLLRGWNLSETGQFAAADSLFAAARGQDSGQAIFPEAWRQLCWSEAVHGKAVEALAACELAVQHTPPTDETYLFTRRNRGIARALAGNDSGAADDLAASEQTTWNDEVERSLMGWIDALRAGTNPFTPAVLAALARH